ncbi:hypothetical protein J4401_00800 [Candidatus Woesearchaeota archaeon]|nr:hypothetical protein [Candidatus Woesearchaeota archaeon]
MKLYFMIFALLLLAGCSGEKGEKSVIAEESIPAGENAMDYSLAVADAYLASRENGSVEFVRADALDCNMCWNFTYNITGKGKAIVSVKAGNVTESVFIQNTIASFEECESDGNQIKEYYPRVCIIDDKNFTETAISLINDTSNSTKALAVSTICINGEKRGEIYFRTKNPMKGVEYQFKIHGKDYTPLLKYNESIIEKTVRFMICEDCKTSRYSDFTLKPDKVYIFRLFFRSDGIGSGEYLIDTREDSELMKKECKNEKIKLEKW